MKLVTKSVLATGHKHSATMIFLHGSGDSGSNVMQWIRYLLGKDLSFKHIKIVYPTAPLQPYTPLEGQLSNVWFDRKEISINVPECRKSLSVIYEAIHKLINDEISNGIPPNRIIVGGFSMGGALALHAGYHLNPDLAGVFALSSFLNTNSIVYDSLKTCNRSKLPQLYMCHGDEDLLVPCEWGLESFQKLQELGVQGEFKIIAHTEHEMKKGELLDLYDWVSKILPKLDLNVQNKL